MFSPLFSTVNLVKFHVKKSVLFSLQTKGNPHMKRVNILKLVQWFCRQITFNDLASAVVIFQEALNGSRKDIEFKQPEKPPNYRRFKLDDEIPLKEEPVKESKDYKELQKEYFRLTGKHIKPVKRRDSSNVIPDGSICSCCHAPARYLYLNNGKSSSQFMCKICKSFSPVHQIRIKPKHSMFCPCCGQALFLWKTTTLYSAYKCSNMKCPRYLDNLKKLTSEERQMIKDGKSSQFKLHYLHRVWHYNPSSIEVKRPKDHGIVDITRIHNDIRSFALILTFAICFGLSARTTKGVLKHVFGISISHQTVINYINAAAYHLYRFIDNNCPKPKGKMAADETYISVNGKWHYTWFGIDSATHAINAFNVSDNRGMEPALAFLYQAFGKPEENASKTYDMVTDGNPSYGCAIQAYNQQLESPSIKGFKVIGLQNLDEESKEYRPFKQLVERLNRTYKFHTRPRTGFKSLEGATALTTLFVGFYNFMRPHSSLKNRPPVELDCLKNIESFPDMWVRLIKAA